MSSPAPSSSATLAKHGRRLMAFLRVNGYSNPTPDGAGIALKVLTLPHKLWRAASVLIGISLDRRYDRRHHVSTCGAILLEQLDIDAPSVEFGELYDSIPERTFHHLIGSLPIERFEDFTFIDYGSGKGRVLFLASCHPFRRIIGVEFSEQLHQCALENLQTFVDPDQRCQSLESHLGDACDFELPDTPLLLFFFTPFHGETLSKVLKRIVDSHEKSPRPIFVIWMTDPETHPTPPELADSLGGLGETLRPKPPFDWGRRYPLTTEVFALKG